MLSSEHLVESTMEQIKDTNPITNSYLETNFPDALQSSEDATIRYKGNKSLSALDGIPIAIKDNINVKGLHTTAGSQFLKTTTSPYDATIVKKLRAAGAIIMGKTNLDEFGMGSYGVNSSFGATKSIFSTDQQSNPSHQYLPGGSSSGAAVALQQYTSFVSIGTDTGGSVRLPAAFTGTVGFKPTYGSISRYGLVAYGSSFDCPGIMTRSVADAKLVYSIVSGPDDNDSTAIFDPKLVPSHFPQLKKLLPQVKNINGLDAISQSEFTHAETRTDSDISNLKSKPFNGLKVGIPEELMFNDLSPGIKEIWSQTADLMKSLGAEIYTISIPSLSHCLPVYYILAQSEAVSNLARYDGLRYGPTHYSNDKEYKIGFYKNTMDKNGAILDGIDLPTSSSSSSPQSQNNDGLEKLNQRVEMIQDDNSSTTTTTTQPIDSNPRAIPSITPLQKLYSTNRELFFGNEVKQRLMVGNYVLSSHHYNSYIEKAMAIRQELLLEFQSSLYPTTLSHSDRFTSTTASRPQVDLILCPTSTSLPPTLVEHQAGSGSNNNNEMAGYIDDVMTVFANIVGAPALSLPAGTLPSPVHNSPLPVGMQLIGAVGSDIQLLDVGAVLQQHIKL